MISTSNRGAQRGATLIVGLIMLALITLMVVTTFTLSTTNLQSVGNMQFRDESIAAATRAIEISFTDTTMPAGTQVGDTGVARNFAIDINNNGVADYTVSVSRTCIRADPLTIPAPPGGGTSCEIDPDSCGATASSEYLVMWDYDATVNDTAVGTSVRVRQGVREQVDQLQCDNFCRPAPGEPCS